MKKAYSNTHANHTRIRFMILFAAVMLFVFPHIASATSTGVMGALDEEIADLKKDMKIEKSETVAGRIFYIGKCEGRDVVLVKSEIGKVNAAMTAQILIDRFKVGRIIFTGVAGGVDENLKPGDIVIATSLAQHDFGMTLGNNFTSNSISIPRPDGTTGKFEYFDTDRNLIQQALDPAEHTKFKELVLDKRGSHYPQVTAGVVVTGDQFIASTKKRTWLKTTFNASAVEMEGAAVGQVCATYGIPFVVIRAMSDLADDIATNTFMLMKDTAAFNSAMLVENMLKDMKSEASPKSENK